MVRNERMKVWPDCCLGKEAHGWMHLVTLCQFPCLCLGLYSATLNHTCQSLIGANSLDFSLTLFPHITQRICTCIVKKQKQIPLTLSFQKKGSVLSWKLSGTLSSWEPLESLLTLLSSLVVSSAVFSLCVLLLTDRRSFSLCIRLGSYPTGAFLPCHHQHQGHLWCISQVLSCPAHICHTCRKQAGTLLENYLHSEGWVITFTICFYHIKGK